jgi:ketosteroid isomerase-like protein
VRRAAVVPLVAAGLGFAAGVAPARAQQPDELSRLLTAVGAAWQRGDAAAIAALGARTGLDLEVHGRPMGSLRGRRAAAALRQLLGAGRTVSVRPGELSLVAGSATQAFAELRWAARHADGVALEETTVFLGFVREPQGWRISQIRVFP